MATRDGMKRALRAVALGAALWGAVRAEDGAKRTAADDAGIQALVAQLGAAEYETREAAQEKLRAFGEAARGALEAALDGDDLETAAGAAYVLRSINLAVIAVRVVDDWLRPRANAEVSLQVLRGLALSCRLRLGWKTERARTDGEGWVTFRDYEPGEGYRLILDCQPEGLFGQTANYTDQNLKVGRNEYVVKCSTQGAKVKGVLLDKEGKPLVGVTVRLAPASWAGGGRIPGCGAMQRYPSCTSSAWGGFRFEGLGRPDEYVVVVVRGLEVLYKSRSFRTDGEGSPVELGEMTTGLDAQELKANGQLTTGK